ncbi:MULTISPECIES: hypothetical protein [Providencia]|uniref:hypothetical protein n=1 Tax=Providencia TaxID=586 RepID=UPI002349D9D1|nr:MULTISPECIES: hypothetical protein [Providencia]
MSDDIFIQAANKVMFSHRTPDPEDVCNLCDKEVGKDNLITGKNANICFDCSDLAKEIADKERERLSKREIKRIAAIISDDEIDMGMAKAYPYAERLYKAGYRKVE